jgi:predicted N-acyltransferase
MHQFEAVFGSLDDYCAALKAHYRDQIVLSRKKFEQGGATMTVVADPVELERIHTPAVHQLYLNVVNRAEMKVEVLTDAFFRALAREMPRQVRMIVFTCRDEILAYTWNLQTDTDLYILFAGVSYERNADFDLYFNLLYATLDYGMRQGVTTIQVGQTADVFKARVGCTSEPRYALAKGVRPLMAWTFRNLLVRLIPRPVPGPKFNIYRAGTAAARPGAAGGPRVG